MFEKKHNEYLKALSMFPDKMCEFLGVIEPEGLREYECGVLFNSLPPNYLDDFHPTYVRHHRETDDYFANLRADNFVVTVGFCEGNYNVWTPLNHKKESTTARWIVVVTANHKGHLRRSVWVERNG